MKGPEPRQVGKTRWRPWGAATRPLFVDEHSEVAVRTDWSPEARGR